MNKFEFVATARNDHGKSVARRMRREEDRIPGVVYGAGKDPQSIALQHNEVLHALDNEAVFSHILKLMIDGKAEQVVLKDVQRHPYKPKIVHVDFLRVSATDKITMHIPLHFIGEEDAPGTKEGGVFTKSITEVEARCLPANLPEFIEIDVSGMKLDEALHLSDIKLPSGVELTLELDEEHDHPVISLHTPKVSREDIEAEAQEAEASEEAAAESVAEKESDQAEAPEATGEEEQADKE